MSHLISWSVYSCGCKSSVTPTTFKRLRKYSSAVEGQHRERKINRPCAECISKARKLRAPTVAQQKADEGLFDRWCWAKHAATNENDDGEFYSLVYLLTQLYPDLDSVPVNEVDVIVRRVNSQLRLEDCPIFGKGCVHEEDDIDEDTKVCITEIVHDQVQQYQKRHGGAQYVEVVDAVCVDVRRQNHHSPRLVSCYRQARVVPMEVVHPGGNYF
jgi:hypothetical protein